MKTNRDTEAAFDDHWRFPIINNYGLQHGHQKGTVKLTQMYFFSRRMIHPSRGTQTSFSTSLLLQLIQGDTEVLPGQRRDIIPPLCAGSALGPPPSWACWGRGEKKPKPPQPALPDTTRSPITWSLEESHYSLARIWTLSLAVTTHSSFSQIRWWKHRLTGKLRAFPFSSVKTVNVITPQKDTTAELVESQISCEWWCTKKTIESYVINLSIIELAGHFPLYRQWQCLLGTHKKPKQ